MDTQWEKDPGFVKYDFNVPEDIPEELHHKFDMIVVDPPFITREVWEKYATAMRLLAKTEHTEGEESESVLQQEDLVPPAACQALTAARSLLLLVDSCRKVRGHASVPLPCQHYC